MPEAMVWQEAAAGPSKDPLPEAEPFSGGGTGAPWIAQQEMGASGLIGTAVSPTESVFYEADVMVTPPPSAPPTPIHKHTYNG